MINRSYSEQDGTFFMKGTKKVTKTGSVHSIHSVHTCAAHIVRLILL